MKLVFFGVDGSGDWRRAEWDGDPAAIPDALPNRRVSVIEMIDEIDEKRHAGWDARKIEGAARWEGPGTNPLRIVLRYLATQ